MVTNAAHGSVVIGIKPVTKRWPARALLWPTGVVSLDKTLYVNSLSPPSCNWVPAYVMDYTVMDLCDVPPRGSRSLSSSKHYEQGISTGPMHLLTLRRILKETWSRFKLKMLKFYFCIFYVYIVSLRYFKLSSKT